MISFKGVSHDQVWPVTLQKMVLSKFYLTKHTFKCHNQKPLGKNRWEIWQSGKRHLVITSTLRTHKIAFCVIFFCIKTHLKYLVGKVMQDLETSIVLSSWRRQSIQNIRPQPWLYLTHLNQPGHTYTDKETKTNKPTNRSKKKQRKKKYYQEIDRPSDRQTDIETCFWNVN